MTDVLDSVFATSSRRTSKAGTLGRERGAWNTHRVRLAIDECWRRLRSSEHGILCTTGSRKTLDAVPVCFATVSELIATPIDRVKPKDTTELGRLRNLDREPTATLLCEHWDRDDWSRLWWVRAHLVRRSRHDLSDALLQECDAALRRKYPQYRDAEFAELVLFEVRTLTGWSAAGPQLVRTDPLI
jgi:hypothetical protein